MTPYALRPHPEPRRRVRRARIVATALAGGGVLGVLTGCSAEPEADAITTTSITDAEGDVVVGGRVRDRGAVVATPRNAVTDVVSTSIDHGADVVTLVVDFAELRPRQYLDLTAYVTTDGTGSRLPAQVTALTYLGESTIDVYEPDGSSRCADATVDIDDEANTVTLSVPRACLGDPRWIEVAVDAATMRYGAAGPDGDAVWEDDALRTGQDPSAGEVRSVRLHHP